MKKILTLSLLIASALTFGQNYKLFHSGSQKLFTTYPIPTTTYSVRFDSVKISGADSVYYNFYRLRDTLVPSNCSWWGGQGCFTQDVPTWMGGPVNSDNAGNYKFFNLQNDSLKFNFSIALTDTAVFYTDASQKFSIVYESADTFTVLNNFDSAHFYKILHTDLAGNPISSVLNSQKIIVAKNFGLARFFQVDSFPQILKPVTLIGNVSPTAGIYQLTNEMLYDHQPGDEIQFHKTSNYPTAPPFMTYNIYEKYIFLSRVTTIDSLIYTVDYYSYNVNTAQLFFDTLVFKYKRSVIIDSLPFERYDLTDNYGIYFSGSNNSFFMKDYCGINMWARKIAPIQEKGYCQAENCWGEIDTGGPPYVTTKTYVFGLGIYSTTLSKFSTSGLPHTDVEAKDIVYFKKNGLTCGTPVTLGQMEIDALQTEVVVKPNPSNNFFRISSSKTFKMAIIYDLEGRMVQSKSLSSTEETIDISQLNDGIYFAKFIFADGKSTSRKIVVLKN